MLTQSYSTDINNPSWDQNFRQEVTVDSASKSDNFKIALFDDVNEVGSASVPFGEVLNAPDMTLQKSVDVGNGAKVNVSICLQGLMAHKMQKVDLPGRSK